MNNIIEAEIKSDCIINLEESSSHCQCYCTGPICSIVQSW